MKRGGSFLGKGKDTLCNSLPGLWECWQRLQHPQQAWHPLAFHQASGRGLSSAASQCPSAGRAARRGAIPHVVSFWLLLQEFGLNRLKRRAGGLLGMDSQHSPPGRAAVPSLSPLLVLSCPALQPPSATLLLICSGMT